MYILIHELKSNKISLIIWTAVVSFMLAVCVLIYPMMEEAMSEMSDMFANMGSFSDAFSMSETTFTDINGYFAIECGEVLGIGGAIFAAIIAIASLSKEERGHTAEFLLTHPISRVRIVLEKLLYILVSLVIFNIGSYLVSALSYLIIGKSFDFASIGLMFFANFLLQFEIAAISFGISAFLRGNGVGIGIGISIGFYFLSLLSKITEETEFLKFITPFSFADNQQILNDGSIEIKYLAVGAVFSIAGIIAAYIKYRTKDIT